MKSTFNKLLLMVVAPLYLTNIAIITTALPRWDKLDDFEEYEEPYYLKNSQVGKDSYDLDVANLSNYHFDLKELTKALEHNPPAKITLEQIEQGKFPDPAHVKHLEVTRQSKEHPLRAAHLRSLVYLYPKITELTLTNLGISQNQAQEIGSHFPKLGFSGPVVKETSSKLIAH